MAASFIDSNIGTVVGDFGAIREQQTQGVIGRFSEKESVMFFWRFLYGSE